MTDDLVNLDDAQEISRRLFVPRVLWLALAVTVLIYVAIGTFVAGAEPPIPLDPTLLAVLGVAALGTAAAIPVLRRALMPPRSDLSGGVGPTRSAAAAAIQRFLTAHIVSLAMAEAVAIFGLILSFISHEPRYVQIFAAFSLVNFAIYFPRADVLVGVLRAAAEKRP